MPLFLDGLPWYALAPLVFAFFLALTVSSVAFGFAAERLFPERKLFAVPLFDGQYRFELLGNVVFLAVVTATVTAALSLRAIHFGEDSTLRNVATFWAMLVGFQVFYWFLHRAMHTKTLLRVHRWHHRSQVTTPLTGQSMHVGEALLWMLGYVGLAVLLSWIAPLGFAGWAGYLAFNVCGNLVGHSNLEGTSSAVATRTGTLFMNAFVFHALHHARWNGHYGFQAAGMDRLMGTEWSDWPALYQRIISGKPLQSLKERG